MKVAQSNERLLEHLELRLTHTRKAAQENSGTEWAAFYENEVEVLEIALAAILADPVADVVAWHKRGEERTCDIRWRRFDVAPGPLYTSTQPPAEYPELLPCTVKLEGMIISKGCKTETLLRSLQNRAEILADIEAMTPDEREEHDAHIEKLKSILPPPPMAVRANGEANSYTLLKNGNWFANILMNGEMTAPQHWDFLNAITGQK